MARSWDGIYVGRRKDLIYAGKVDHGFDKGIRGQFAQAPDAVDSQDAALCEADRV
jgi:hypothetical protein